MRTHLLYAFLSLGCAVCGGCTPAAGGCVTNSQCPGGYCVNGLCTSATDASVPDVSVDAASRDAGASMDATNVDTQSLGPNRCVAWTCEGLGQVCRSTQDGCGGSLDCGDVEPPAFSEVLDGLTQLIEWRFPEGPSDYLEHRICFDEVPSRDDGFGRGLLFVTHDGYIAGQRYYVSIADGVEILGGAPGIIFSKIGDANAEHLRPGDASAVPEVQVEQNFIGLRTPMDWGTGCYTLRLRVGAADAGGDWVELNLNDSAQDFALGSIWFERMAADTPVVLPSRTNSYPFAYGFVGASSLELPHYAARISAVSGGGDVQEIVSSYEAHGIRTSSSEYLPEDDEVRWLVGGNTHRCAPGVTNGDTSVLTWVPR